MADEKCGSTNRAAAVFREGKMGILIVSAGPMDIFSTRIMRGLDVSRGVRDI